MKRKAELDKVFLQIKYTAGYFDKMVNKFLEPFKISEQQYNILRILKGAGKPITVKMVKERLIRKSPNATRLMDKLCDKELIERSRCENDRRVVYIEIREEGKRLLDNIKLNKMINPLENLTDKEIDTLNKILDKIVKTE